MKTQMLLASIMSLGTCLLAHAEEVFLSGSITPGIHEYFKVDVVVDGELYLNGDTTIRVYGGSIIVDAPIDGQPDETIIHGTDGDNSVVPPIPPTAGENGKRGWNLMLETRPWPYSDPGSDNGSENGGPGSGPGGGLDPTPAPVRGDIIIKAWINLNGTDGGKGGNGDQTRLVGGDEEKCLLNDAQNGAPGGNGGNGGNFTASSCRHIILHYGAGFDLNGGNGGEGGRGGAYTTLRPDDVAGNGAAGGRGGNGGHVVLTQSLDAANTDQIRFDGWGWQFNVYTSGGHAGMGGDGGTSASTYWGDWIAGFPGDGGNGGHGGLGGAFRVYGNNINLYDCTSFVVADGGGGQAGGHGGASGAGYCLCGCYGEEQCIPDDGGTPGLSGNGGNGGAVVLLNNAGREIKFSGQIMNRGGAGSMGGNGGAGGNMGCTSCSLQTHGQDGATGGRGGNGGTVSIVTSQTNSLGVVQLDYFFVYGHAGTGGLGGYGPGTWECDEIPNCQYHGNGGAGGPGGNGGNVLIRGYAVNMPTGWFLLDGGDGGYGNYGSRNGGDGGPAGVDGQLTVVTPNPNWIAAVLNPYTQADGEDGLDGPCAD